MKRAISIFAAVVLASCGTTSSVRVNFSVSDSMAFQLFDARPDEERKSRTEESTGGVTSFYGDEKLSPSAPDLLKSYLTANLADKLSGKVVKLKAFNVSAFDPKVTIDSTRFSNAVNSVPNANPLGVMLAAPVIFGIESIKSQKYVSVNIHGSVDEKEYSSQCSNSFRGRVTEDNVRSVVLTCLEQFSGDIESGNSIAVVMVVTTNAVDIGSEADVLAPTVNCVVNGERTWTKPSKCDP